MCKIDRKSPSSTGTSTHDLRVPHSAMRNDTETLDSGVLAVSAYRHPSRRAASSQESKFKLSSTTEVRVRVGLTWT